MARRVVRVFKESSYKKQKNLLSLGSKEHKTRNALMKNVLKNTLEAYKIYQKENDCFFQKIMEIIFLKVN